MRSVRREPSGRAGDDCTEHAAGEAHQQVGPVEAVSPQRDEPAWLPEAIYLPPAPSGHVVVDALMAAIAEKLADDSGLPRPSWTAAVPPLDDPYEPPARRRGVVPEQFERRGLLIDGESLFRAKDTQIR